MRRLMLAFAVTAALVLSVVAPAAAAPTPNPWTFDVAITCDGETFVGTTTGKVGFLEEVSPGAVVMAVGGTRSLYATDGDVLLFTLEFAPPPGLLVAGMVEACTAYVDFGDAYAVWHPLLIKRTPNFPQ